MLDLVDYDKTIGEKYFDLSSSVITRNKMRIEGRIIANVAGANPAVPEALSITGWIMRGAIREDDNPSETSDTDEPGGPFFRVFNHFYDPANGKGLSRFGIPIGAPAPDWALVPGTTGPVFLVANKENHFTIANAREAMWRALTLKTSTGGDDIPPSDWTGTKEERRKAYWATVFRALGDVVHLVQDMGQPQHTRNDAHAGWGCAFGECAGGHDSFFERYIAARTTGATRFTLKDGANEIPVRTKADPLVFGTYDPPNLPTYASYFADSGSGRGLAQYSNRGFYSFGTNAGSNSPYASPPPDATSLADLILPQAEDAAGNQLPATLHFKTGTVHDDLTATDVDDVKLTTVGLWDQFLLERSNSPRYTLNWYNYDDQARLLLPRAIGYSAGILNYFFRGRLSVTLPDEGVFSIVDHSVVKSITTVPPQGFTVVKAKVSNQTPAAGAAAQDMNNGLLVAVAKFHRNTCYTEDLKGEWGSPDMRASKGDLVFEPPEAGGCRTAEEEIIVSPPLTNMTLLAGAAPQTLQFDFSATPIPINATDLKLQVVYRGPLGAEQDAVVVATVDINEPYFTGYTNASDNLLCVQNRWYVRDASGNFPPEVGMYSSTIMDDVRIAYEPSDASPELNPLIQFPELDPNQAVRYAVLAPLGTKWGIYWREGAFENRLDTVLFPADLTTLANQVYVASAGPGEAPVLTKRAREVFKERNSYIATGIFFNGGDGSYCDFENMPEDPIPAPQLLHVSINPPFD